MVAVGWSPGSTPPGEPGGEARSDDQFGRGRRDPETGIYEWYEIPAEVKRERSGESIAWTDILSRWRLVEADLHSEFGVDVGDQALMRSRSWRWLETRISGLLSADTRLHRALSPEPESGRA